MPQQQAKHRPEEKAAHLKLVGLKDRIEDVCGRCHDPRPPKVRSTLWDDDQATKPYQVSHAAWTAMQHATDHLAAAYAMTVQQDGPTLYNIVTRPWAVYPSPRASYENAARALWLLGGPTRKIRVERCLRHEYNNAEMSDAATELLGRAGTQARDIRSKLDAIAKAAGFGTARTRKWLKIDEIMGDGVGVMGVDPALTVVFWRCLSALTHGDRWASLGLLDKDEVATSPDGKMVTLMFSTNAATLATFMDLILQTCEQAVVWYDRQSRTMFTK